MILVDSLLNACALKYNAGLAKEVRSLFSIDFETYRYNRQYMAVFNGEGEKEVWVNAPSNPHKIIA